METPSEHFVPVSDIMGALKKSLAGKRKPADSGGRRPAGDYRGAAEAGEENEGGGGGGCRLEV